MSYLEGISVQTPLGDFHMITSNQGGKEVVHASGFGDIAKLRQRLPLRLRGVELRNTAPDHPYAVRVHDYFNGDLTSLDVIPREQEGGVFYQKVWRAMQAIPPGQTLSYKELAAQADNPTAVRAAGTACAKNLLILLVPCHRIVKSNGELGDYVYGSKMKADLLAHEAKYQNHIKEKIYE